MKRLAARITIIGICLIICASCSRSRFNQLVEGKVNVVTSFYPIYEFAAYIGGENAHVINLLPAGVEPHEWTPRSNDLIMASKAQLFLYNGAGLEGWVPHFLKGLSSNSALKTVEVSKGIPLIEGSGGGDQEQHEGNAEREGGQHQVDPHTWVSPRSAIQMVQNIKMSYISTDPSHRQGYEERSEQLIKQMNQLDQRFTRELAEVSKREIVVSHQSFGYLCRDYGLTQHALMGLSPDAEPRAQDIIRLSKLVREENIQYIFFEDLVSNRLAKTLAEETGVHILSLSPIEGLTRQQEKDHDNYFTLMARNLEHLLAALK